MIIRGGAMSAVLHVVKRLLLVIAGYLVGTVVSLIGIVILYFVLSNLPGAPSYFGAMGVSPLLILIFPPAWLLVFYVAVILTCMPSLVGALISELFSLRHAVVSRSARRGHRRRRVRLCQPHAGRVDRGNGLGRPRHRGGRRVRRRHRLLADRRAQCGVYAAAAGGYGLGRTALSANIERLLHDFPV